MRGEKVIVRTYGNVPVICKVWDVDKNRVLVCDEAAFLEMLKGTAPRPDCFPIPFPKDLVFKYDKRSFETAKAHIANPGVWSTLERWTEKHV
jgi:hypothetical protein